MARCMVEGETFAGCKDKWVTDEVTGEKKKESLPKRVKAWYYPLCQDSCRCAKKAQWLDATEPCCTSDEGRPLGVAD